MCPVPAKKPDFEARYQPSSVFTASRSTRSWGKFGVDVDDAEAPFKCEKSFLFLNEELGSERLSYF